MRILSHLVMPCAFYPTSECHTHFIPPRNAIRILTPPRNETLNLTQPEMGSLILTPRRISVS